MHDKDTDEYPCLYRWYGLSCVAWFCTILSRSPAGTGMEEYWAAAFPSTHGQLDHPVFLGLVDFPVQWNEGRAAEAGGNPYG